MQGLQIGIRAHNGVLSWITLDYRYASISISLAIAFSRVINSWMPPRSPVQNSAAIQRYFAHLAIVSCCRTPTFYLRPTDVRHSLQQPNHAFGSALGLHLRGNAPTPRVYVQTSFLDRLDQSH